jgi:hypothetical protein
VLSRVSACTVLGGFGRLSGVCILETETHHEYIYIWQPSMSIFTSGMYVRPSIQMQCRSFCSLVQGDAQLAGSGLMGLQIGAVMGLHFVPTVINIHLDQGHNSYNGL